MNIDFKIYNEKELDPFDILGEINLSDDKTILRDTNVYLDSWLCGFVEGLIIIKSGYNCIIDLVEEPNPLEFTLSEKNAKISYKQTSVIVEDINIFEKVLKKTCVFFLKKIRNLRDIPTLKFLNDFIEDKIDSSMLSIQPVIKKWK